MVIILDILYMPELFINLLLVSRFWANRLYILIKNCIIMQIINNIVVGYILFIENNFFQLDVAYISPFNGSFIFYSAPAVFLNNWEDLISVSFSTNSKQTIIPDIFKDEDNSLIKQYKYLGYLGYKILIKIITIIPGIILLEPKLVKIGFTVLLNDQCIYI